MRLLLLQVINIKSNFIMKHLKALLLCFAFLLFAGSVCAESSYDIAELYEIIRPSTKTKAVDSYSRTIDVEYILSPTTVETGKYVVKVKKIGENLYQIIGTDICVETRYCYEFASFSEEVVLIIESNYGYKKGKIIFD